MSLFRMKSGKVRKKKKKKEKIKKTKKRKESNVEIADKMMMMIVENCSALRHQVKMQTLFFGSLKYQNMN